MRIGERTLDRVILTSQCRREGVRAGVEQLEPAGVVRRKRSFAANDVERSLALRARFSEEQRPCRKIKRREPYLAGHAGAPLPPAEPAGNHQMKHRKQLVVEHPHDALAEPAESAHVSSDQRVEWRIDGPYEKWARQPHRVEPLTDDAATEGRQIELDVREFRHQLERVRQVASPALPALRYPTPHAIRRDSNDDGRARRDGGG